MAKTIVENMERERDAGNLELGQVGSSEMRVMETESSAAEVLVSEEVVEKPVAETVAIEEVSEEELAMDNSEQPKFGM